MPTSTQRKPRGQGDRKTPLLVLDTIDLWLKEMRRTWPSKELEAEEIENWHKDLSAFPVEAIEQAFDAWRRNGHWFPVYVDIINLCAAYKPEPKYRPGCDAICKARHGQGYNQVDIKWLYDLYLDKKATLPNRPMTEAEVEDLLAQLDKKRGRSPAWRTGY